MVDNEKMSSGTEIHRHRETIFIFRWINPTDMPPVPLSVGGLSVKFLSISALRTNYPQRFAIQDCHVISQYLIESDVVSTVENKFPILQISE
jgi:hypothetical protein